jgi:hypothetical protein
MSFEQLLGRIAQAATLAKSLPAGGDKNQGGSSGGDKNADAGAAGNADADAQDDEDDGGDGGGASGSETQGQKQTDKQGDATSAATQDEPIAKSFRLTLDDGTEMEAFDGAELIKSLTARVQSAESTLKQNEAQVLKSLNAAVDLMSAQAAQLKGQDALIKSLQTKVDALGKTGRGRASVLTIVDKPQLETVSKSQATTVGGEELIVKALGAMKAGRISGLEASGVENRVRMGIAVDPELVARVCG